MHRTLLGWIALSSIASAQITFPVGETYGYSIASESTTTLPSFPYTDTAFNFFTVPAGATSLSLSDSVSAKMKGEIQQVDFQTGHVSLWKSEILDPDTTPSGVLGTSEFNLNATSSAIYFTSTGQARHEHIFSDPFFQAAQFAVSTEEQGVNGGVVVPFDALNGVQLNVNNLLRNAGVSNVAISGSGTYSVLQTGTLAVQLLRFNGLNWVSMGKITNTQFVGPFSMQLAPGRYAISITFSEMDKLTTVGNSPGYAVSGTADDFMLVDLSFQ